MSAFSRLHPLSQALLFSILVACVPHAAQAAQFTLVTPLDSRSAATQESTFGDLTADAILASAPDADFAILPADEMRRVLIPAGKTDTDTLEDALRAGNDSTDTVVVMKATGEQIKTALSHGFSRAPGPYDGFLQVSGLVVKYDPSKHGEDRVLSVTLTKTGQPLDPARTYHVAMPSYLASGALGYFDIWSKSEPPSDTHEKLADALQKYVLAKQTISYQISSRIATQ